jgi:hypothetical protein
LLDFFPFSLKNGVGASKVNNPDKELAKNTENETENVIYPKIYLESKALP